MAEERQSQLQANRHRRWLRVTLSVVVSVLAVFGYIAGDTADIFPGTLTWKSLEAPIYPKPVTAITGGTVAGKVDADSGIDSSKLRSLVSQFGENSAVGSDYSIAITDMHGKILAGHEENQVREPASTLKTLTALAAASTLDMGGAFETQTFLNQAQNGSVTLVLKGNGDMLLGAGLSDPNHINGRAGLGTLAIETAHALTQRGISSVQLVYDDSLFGADRSPANIAANNPGNAYFTGVSSMAVDGGRQWSSPPADADTYTDYPQLSEHTAEDAAATFAQRLAENGVQVQGNAVQGAVPAGLSPIASVRSATLGEVMAFMLRHSDNTLAEEFGRLTALHMQEENSPDGAVKAVTAKLKQLGIPLSGVVMADCSGLSPGSRVSALTLASVQAVNLRDVGAAEAGEGLSIPGLVGTAQTRLVDPNQAGLIRVKTGSLDEVTSMAGNISCSHGGVLTFAVIVNDPSDYSGAKDAIDTFISQLAGL